MVLFTLKLNLVEAACCNVEVMKGAFGFTLVGVFTISVMDNFDACINCSICFASSAVNKGSDFFLESEKLIFSSLLLRRFIEISQYSFGINS